MDKPDKPLTTCFRKLTTEQKIESAIQLIRAIKDPELGDIGEKFYQEVIDTGCTQVIDTSLKSCLASYCSFNFSKGFLNRITYGKVALQSKGRLASAQEHESTHAVQKKNSAALHASPFNPDTTIVICPRDWVTLEERCEEGAYAMQALLNSLAVSIHPSIRETAKWDPVTVEEFEKIRASTSDVVQAVAEAARRSLDKSFINPPTGYLFRNKVQDVALANYELAMSLRQDKEKLTFVRLDPEDIAAIGATCGFDIFGKNKAAPQFMGPSPLSRIRPDATEEDKHPLSPQERLDKLNRECGIPDTGELQTLGEYLASKGKTREEFVNKTYKKPPPQPPASGAKPSGL